MAKPWERYQANTGGAPATGPWSRYRNTDSQSPADEGPTWGGEGLGGVLSRFAAGANEAIGDAILSPLDLTSAASEALGFGGGLTSDKIQDAVNSRIGGPSSEDDLGTAGAVGEGAGLGLSFMVPVLGAARGVNAGGRVSRINQGEAAAQLGGTAQRSDSALRRAASELGIAKDTPTVVINRGTTGTGLTAGARRVGEDMVDRAAAAPGLITAGEVAGNAGASAGAEAADPDDPVQQLLYTLGGGLTGGGVASALEGAPRAIARVPSVRGGLSIAGGMRDRAMMAMGGQPKASEARAATTLQRQASDFDRAERNFTQARANNDDAPVRAQLDDEGLNALERRLRLNNPEFAAQQQQRDTDALSRAAGGMRNAAGEGTLADTGRAARERMAGFNQQAQGAAENARGRGSRILRTEAPAEPEYQNSAAFNRALEGARSDARQEVNQYWRQTDQFKDQPAPAQNTVAAFDSLRDDLGYASGQAGRELPGYLRRVLDRARPDGPAETTVGELDGLRRQITRDLRGAEGTKAYALRQMREAVYQDLDGTPGDAGEAVRTAVGASRELHNRFSRDIVGRLLGRSGSGGERVQPEEVLRTALPTNATSGTKGVANLRQIGRSLDGPENAAGRALVSGNERAALSASRQAGQVRQQVSDYYYRRMVDAGTTGGQMSPAKMRQFLETNRDAMNSSELTRDTYARLSNAVNRAESGDARALEIENIMNQRAPKEARAAQFIDGMPDGSDGDAFMGNLRRMVLNGDAGRNVEQLRRQVRRDETGLAEQGLQNGILNTVLDEVRRQGQPDAEALLRVVNGNGTSVVERQLNRAIQTGLTSQQRDMMRRTAESIARIQRGAQGSAAPDSILRGGALEQLIRNVFAIHAGNAAGGMIAPGGAGGGANTSLAAGQQAIGMFRQLFGWLADSPTELVLRKAFQDPDTMRALLDRGSSRNRSDQATRVLGTWMAQALPPAAEVAENEVRERTGSQ